MTRRMLDGWTVAVSISDSPDLPYLGLGVRHLQDMMVEMARHLMAAGAQLLYGGDLRQNGYTGFLAEVAARHQAMDDEARPAFVNMLPWPVHARWDEAQIAQLTQAFADHATLERLDREGRPIAGDRPVEMDVRLDDAVWAHSLTTMRTAMARRCNARIALGGQVANYKGRMPGIAEEVLIAVEHRKPTFVLGGFGGCAADICEDLRLLEPRGPRRDWQMRAAFSDMPPARCGTGLEPEELHRLARTVHADEAVALVLRGLSRIGDRR